jgi:hypothetical protein
MGEGNTSDGGIGFWDGKTGHWDCRPVSAAPANPFWTLGDHLHAVIRLMNFKDKRMPIS